LTPPLSVVMTSLNARDTIERSLASVEPQRDAVDLEFVLVDSSTDGTDRLVAERFPWVKILHFDTRKFCGDGRNIGIAHSSAPVIAFLDADCLAAPDWARRIVDAHANRPDAPVIGGAIGNANPHAWAGWAYYFTEFAQWSPGQPAGPMDDIPGCSLTLKRSAFERWGPFLEGSYCSDSAFHWQMARDGHRPWFDPSIRVDHLNPTRLWNIAAHAQSHGRQFGHVRRAQQRPGPATLAKWRFGAPAVPAVLLARTVGHVARGGDHVGRLLTTWPAVLAIQAAWTLGEARSYWAAENGSTS